MLEADVNDLVQNLTLQVRITGMRGFRFRVWLCFAILRLAWFVLPFNVEMEERSTDAG